MAYCFNPACPQPRTPDISQSPPSVRSPSLNPTVARFCQACGTPLLLNDRYRLISLLGQGGFGRTFLAEQVSLAERAFGAGKSSAKTVEKAQAELGGTGQCVIKQMNKSVLANPSNTSAFEAEADRLRTLGKHPQIPRLFDAFENDWGQFLVQEFAPGDNLQTQVAAQGPWGEADVRSLLKSLVAVLQYVHGFQIIHRDIKPDNIVSQPSGLPILVDFGSAKWVRQTPAKTVIGSAGYASPEQSMGQATFASDIYSLGLTCLHLLTGVHPFGLYSAAEDRWVWKDYLTSPIDPGLAQVLDQMVARSLQQRYASMDQVDLALKSSQNGLMAAPQQLLTKAKESMPGLKSFLITASKTVAEIASKTDGNASLSTINPTTQALSTSPTPAITAAQSWRRLNRLAPDIGLTEALVISPDGQLMVSSGPEGSVHLWDVLTAQLMHTFPRRRMMGDGHRGGVTALAFHPDGRALYSASVDGTVKEWDVAERRLLNTLNVPGWTLTDLLVTPDGTQLMGANGDGKIVVWEIASLLPVAQLTQHQRCVNAIAFCQSQSFPDGLLVSASDDGTVKLWPQTRQDGQRIPRLAKSITLPQGDAARTGIGRKFNGKTIGQGKGPSRAIALALRPISQSAQELIVATEYTVLLYHLDAYLDVPPPIVLHQSEALITAIAVSGKVAGSDAQLAIGTDDRLLTLWQLEAQQCVAELSHDWGVSAIAFTPDSQMLVTASADEVISLWQRGT